MTCGLDEVHTRVDAVVHNVHAVDLVLRLQVGIESLLNVLHDGPPRLIVVDEITEAWRIDDCQSQADPVLLDIGADGLYGHGLWMMSRLGPCAREEGTERC